MSVSTDKRLVQVRFFAILREQAGISSCDVDTAATDPASLYAELQSRFPGLAFPVHLLRVSINERYADMSTPLNARDRIVFLPPVAGG